MLRVWVTIHLASVPEKSETGTQTDIGKDSSEHGLYLLFKFEQSPKSTVEPTERQVVCRK